MYSIYSECRTITHYPFAGFDNLINKKKKVDKIEVTNISKVDILEDDYCSRKTKLCLMLF